MAKVLVLKSEAASPSQADVLAARRAELSAEAAKLGKVAEARLLIERRLQEADAEQAALDEREREAWRVWAQNDAAGPPPSPRTRERESLAQRRALIANDLTGALAGEKAVAPRLAALNADLREVMLKLYARRVDALIGEAEKLNAEVHATAQAFVAVAEQADGLLDAVVEAQARAVNGVGDGPREAILRAAFSRLERLNAPRLAGDALERARHAAAYARRLA